MADQLFTRKGILDGLPARRAGALLFLIESRTALLSARSRRAMEKVPNERAAEERDLAFLEAFSAGREPPRRPTVQELERHAGEWAALVPDNPAVRAATVRAMGKKYGLAREQVPGIRAALGLDEEAVQQAYRRLYGEELESLYGPPTGAARLRWLMSRFARALESLPPFWTAFALTLTETVGAGTLALPIAVAGVGPLAGVVLLAVLGLVNILTVAAMAEAATRSGSVRYGGFVGRMVGDYLGPFGTVVLSVAVAAISVLALQAFYVGFATTLADATRVPAPVWTALLFLLGVYFLRRESLNATVTSALIVGAVNIGLIVVLSLLGFAHARAENLLYVNVPFMNGRPFDPSILQLVFGVILSAYFGHLSVSNCARVVLRRDPTSRSLVWGVVAGQVGAMLIYIVWVLAVNGAVAPQALAAQAGTAIISLAAQVGPSVQVIGSIYVLLAMTMSSIHFSLGLYNLVRERLPSSARPVLLLPRRRAQLLLRPRRRREAASLILTYLGLGEVPEQQPWPHFRLDLPGEQGSRRFEIAVDGRWDDSALGEAFQPWRTQGFRLALEVLDAGEESVRLRLSTSLAVAYEGTWDTAGLHVADLLTLPDRLQSLVNWIVRQGQVGVDQVADHSGMAPEEARQVLAELVEQGFLRESSEGDRLHYKAQFAPRRARRLSPEIDRALGVEPPNKPEPLRRPTLAASPLGRFLLATSPVAAVFVVTEVLFFAGKNSFSTVISIVGVLIVSLLAGIFPMLLLVSSRRKGDLAPGLRLPLVGHPVVVGAILLLSLGSILLHGLVIWTNPVARAIALLVAALVVVMTVSIARRGAFATRLVVQLRQEGGRGWFEPVAAGRPAPLKISLYRPDGSSMLLAPGDKTPDMEALRKATFAAPAGLAHDLKVWAHQVNAAGESQGLAGQVRCGDGAPVSLVNGQAVLALGEGQVEVELSWSS